MLPIFKGDNIINIQLKPGDMRNILVTKEWRRAIIPLILALFSWAPVSAQIGELLWEENFNNLDNWNISIGNGSWGWGNGELEFYREENVEIAALPGEEDNMGLKITARQESGPGIVDQWGNPLHYTSGKVNTKSRIAIKYGMIETRVRIPDIDLGGWPAVWLLGLSNLNWPSKGEIDMMEMGHSKVFRDLHDAHNGGNDADNSSVNQVVGSNAIFFSEAAIVPGNPLGAASISWDPDDAYCRPYYNYDDPLSGRFLIYRTYWDENSIRFTIIDKGIEYDLYTEPFPITDESDEFRQPFYLISNLAIGGAFTDAYSLGDPGSGAPVSMPFPAEMYLDYIKVYSWNGQGEVRIGPPENESGVFGIYTDETPIDKGLIPGENAEIYVWEGTLSEGSVPPYEGENGISWKTTGKGWFGAGVLSFQPINLLDFGNGHLKFRIKIPGNISFKIGIIDAWGNQEYVDFPANQSTFGLVRDGQWGQAAIPVSVIRGQVIDLRMLSYEFVILEVNGASCEFGLDDIYWEDGITGVRHPVEVKNKNYLRNNAPNPFTEQTAINFHLDEKHYVQLNIVDSSGHLIESLVADTIAAGTHTVTWDAGRYPSGLYYYQLKVGNQQEVKKCLLLR
jgi:beta-glucanase (GH16 family)